MPMPIIRQSGLQLKPRPRKLQINPRRARDGKDIAERLVDDVPNFVARSVSYFHRAVDGVGVDEIRDRRRARDRDRGERQADTAIIALAGRRRR